MISVSKKLQTAQNITGATVNFDALDVTSVSRVCAQVFTGGAGLTGTAKLQLSNNGSDWVDATNPAEGPAASGAVVSNGSVMVSCRAVSGLARLVVTLSAGTAATTYSMIGKEF